MKVQHIKAARKMAHCCKVAWAALYLLMAELPQPCLGKCEWIFVYGKYLCGNSAFRR